MARHELIKVQKPNVGYSATFVGLGDMVAKSSRLIVGVEVEMTTMLGTLLVGCCASSCRTNNKWFD
jgi:hypothetical protein